MHRKLNTFEAAKYLGLSKGTLEVWRCHGRGPRYAKLGRRVVYSLMDLQKFVDENKVRTTGQ